MEEHIIIGSDRHITVPETLKKIAVQFDHNAETVTFDCPRYWDEHDLSKMAIYVNYMRPDETLGAHLCDNVVIDRSDPRIMHFDWTISGHVTEMAGPLSFLVCIRNVDSAGNETAHWNTELNTDMYISSGMRCRETILRKYPDIITQLLLRMDEAETSIGDRLDEIADVTAKANAALDSLEEFKTSLTEDVTEFKNEVNADTASAANSASAAASSASAAKTSETNAKSSETAAKTSETNAKSSATNAKTSETNSKTSETNAAASAAAAKAAQEAAEAARDSASEIAGGDFASTIVAQGYANTAESNANKYTDEQIDALPTISNPNLLDNWYLADPINQRGAAKYTAAGYTVDRWKLIGTEGNISLNPAMTITNSDEKWQRIYQHIGNVDQLAGRTVTLSVLASGSSQFYGLLFYNNESSGTGIINQRLTESVKLFTATRTIPEDVTSVYVGIGMSSAYSAGSMTIYAVKLELGSTQTLAHQDADGNWILNDPPPDKGMEMLKCCMSTADSGDIYANNKMTPTAINALALDGSNCLLRHLTIDTSSSEAITRVINYQERTYVRTMVSDTDYYDLVIGADNFKHSGRRNNQVFSYDILHTGNRELVSKTFTVTVPYLDWLLWDGGWYKTVTVDGMLATDNPMVDVVLGTDATANESYIAAWTTVQRVETADGYITIYTNGDPQTAFSIQLKVVR